MEDIFYKMLGMALLWGVAIGAAIMGIIWLLISLFN